MRYWEQELITIFKLIIITFATNLFWKVEDPGKICTIYGERSFRVAPCSHFSCRNEVVFNIFQYIFSYWLGWVENEMDIFDSSQYSELVLTKSNFGKLADILAGADILLDFISMTRQKRKIQIMINSVFKTKIKTKKVFSS